MYDYWHYSADKGANAIKFASIDMNSLDQRN